MKLKIEINLDNAAFKGNDNQSDTEATRNELEHAFKVILHAVEYNVKSGKLHDSNGNTVGQWEIIEEEEEQAQTEDEKILCPCCKESFERDELGGHIGNLCPACGRDLLC